MHFTNFEILNLQINDPIFVINENGEGLHGRYLGEYSRSKGTFKFFNSGSGITQTITINNVQHVNKS